MTSATVTSKGQTTIPKVVRRHLNLKPGDRIEFVIEDDGRVVLSPKTVPIASLRGLLGKAPRHLTIDEIHEAVREAAVSRYRR